MARDPSDPGTMDFDFGDPTLNDPDYEGKVEAEDGSADATPTGADQAGAPQAERDTVSSPTDDGQPAAGPSGGATQARPAEGQAPVGAVKADAKGNLVDAQGNIVATAGPERRHYERAQQLQRHARTLEAENAQLKQASGMAQVLNGAPEKLGLDRQETEMGLQVIASFKKDPVATARWALQETMRMGYNLAQIVGADAQGQPLSGSMDLGAVKAMISEAVAPLVGDRQAAVQQQQVAQRAEREYTAFIAKHENASVHEEVLAGMLNSDRGLTPETAYWQLQAYVARNGLDFTRPLRPQVLARQGQRQAPNGDAQPARAQNGQPMPNGVQPSASMQSGPDLAAPDASWDSIVQQSLRDAGFH